MKSINFMKNGIQEVKDYANKAKVHGSEIINEASNDIMSTELGRKTNAFVDKNAGILAGTGLSGGGAFALTNFADPVKTEW